MFLKGVAYLRPNLKIITSKKNQQECEDTSGLTIRILNTKLYCQLSKNYIIKLAVFNK